MRHTIDGKVIDVPPRSLPTRTITVTYKSDFPGSKPQVWTLEMDDSPPEQVLSRDSAPDDLRALFEFLTYLPMPGVYVRRSK